LKKPLTLDHPRGIRSRHVYSC